MDTELNAIPNKGTHELSLREIASWDPGVHLLLKSDFRASVPALQRGLVWKPSQLELLWDSILRGFPIGSLVVCRKIEGQIRSKDDQQVNYHLLDGQQRCNAIALGFTDPFPLDPESVATATENASILWIDLRPRRDRNSTRNYLIRVTTVAHPWGYTRNDNNWPLSAKEIRASLEKLELDPAASGYSRPLPSELSPQDASVPVPLAWLLTASPHNEQVFWDEIAERARAIPHCWTATAIDFLQDLSIEAAKQRSAVFKGVQRAHSARVIALVAPEELLEESQQESAIEGPQEAISNIEHLFQRLNQQGTPLDDEELAYSMIKAYWPELADSIDEAAQGRMPEARMVSLGVQAALAIEESDRLPARRGVSDLRAIARNDDARKKRITEYIQDELEANCSLVDRWLRYDPEENPSGLLPVHITSIALRSRDVYLLLLCLASRLRARDDSDGISKWGRYMQGMATILHWFGAESSNAANRLYRHCHQKLTIEHLTSALVEAVREREIHPIHAPKELEAFMQAPGSLKDWYWWKLIDTGDGNEDEMELRHHKWWGMLDFRGNKELLLYAQREYLNTRFPGYNPARRDLWADHNRPWDFDHLLASKYVNNRTGIYRSTVQQWLNTIGNLRAWPFEDNRSDQFETAQKKIGSVLELLGNSFLREDELRGFSHGEKVRTEEGASREFMEICRNRLVRIYQNWFEAMPIADLLGLTTANNPAVNEPEPLEV